MCPPLCPSNNHKQPLTHWHTRATHSSGSDQSQREEDFYYTKISCETVDASSAPAPSQQALGQASSSHLSWASCGSPPGSGLQIPPAHRPRSNSTSGPGPSRPSPLSQSAPSSFWQIHSEHLYQVGAAVFSSVTNEFWPTDCDSYRVLAGKLCECCESTFKFVQCQGRYYFIVFVWLPISPNGLIWWFRNYIIFGRC